MASFTGLGIGLSFVFGCILFALVGELYYLLWCKRRINSRGIEDHHYRNHAGRGESYLLFCWKKPSCLDARKMDQQVINLETDPDANNGHEPDLELGPAKDLLKGFGEESVESELMRVHNLCGPPRFLCTINEETKEDLESDDGKSRGDRSRKGSRHRSLSDLLVAVETPILTPLRSPTLKAHNPLESSYNHHAFNFNPLFESSTEVEMNRLRSSPPPKFKFMRDAEEKLIRRLMEEAEKRASKESVVKAPPTNSTVATEERDDGSFIRIIVGTSKNREREVHQQLPQYHSTASQVLPLASSPSTTFRLLDNNKPIQQ